MTVVAAIVTNRLAVIGTDSRTFISGASADSVVDEQKSKITRIRSMDDEVGLLAFAGDSKFEKRLIELLLKYSNPSRVPPEEWPEDDDDEAYNSLYICESGLWLIMGKSNIVKYPTPCFATAGSGGDVAGGSIVTQTWRRKSLGGLSERDARRIIRRAIEVACRVDIACGGKIRISRL